MRKLAMWALCWVMLITGAAARQITLSVQQQVLDIPAEYGAAFVDENGRTQIPLRYVLERCGFAVHWQQQQRLVTIDSAAGPLTLTVGSPILTTPQGDVIMDTVAQQREGGRVYIPLRPVLEALGLTVHWQREADTDRIDITGPLGRCALYVDTVAYTVEDLAHYLDYLRLEWDVDDTQFSDDPEGGAETLEKLQDQARRELSRLACLKLLCQQEGCAPTDRQLSDLAQARESMVAALGGEEEWNAILAGYTTTPYAYDLYARAQLYLDGLYDKYGAEEGERLLEQLCQSRQIHTTVWFDAVTAATCLDYLS